MKKDNTYIIIMAGGVGKRFWPASKKSMPKQFLDILGVGKSLLQITYDRYADWIKKENIFIVTNKSYALLVEDQLPKMPTENILLEPMAKNTEACVAYTSYKIKQLNPDAVCVVAPSDHLIGKSDKFLKIIEKGVSFAEKNEGLVTIGIKPNEPNTGYGYIQMDRKAFKPDVYKVKTFAEKPTLKYAKLFLESGDFLWNGGIFIWSVKDICAAFEKYDSDISDIFKKGNEVYNTPAESDFLEKAYPLCKNISIDYSILEKHEKVYVMEADIGWSDLGTWKSIYEHCPKEKDGNVLIGDKIIANECMNSIIVNQSSRLMAVQSVTGMIVIQTESATLICNINREQKVKDMVSSVEKKYGLKYI